MKTFLALLAMAAAAAAQTPTPRKNESPIEWTKLRAGPVEGPKAGTTAAGTRVKITLRNGNILRGTVIHPAFLREVNPKDWRPRAHDFSKVSEVLLDIRLDQPDLGGYVWIRRRDIREPILELTPLDPAAIKRLEEERERIEKEREESFKRYDEWKSTREKEDEEARKRREKEESTAKETDELDKKKAELEKTKEAVRFYDKFPGGSAEDQQAGKAWGPERLKAIQQKLKSLMPLTAEEQEFMSGYDLWSTGKKYRDEEKKKKEEKKEGNP